MEEVRYCTISPCSWQEPKIELITEWSASGVAVIYCPMCHEIYGGINCPYIPDEFNDRNISNYVKRKNDDRK